MAKKKKISAKTKIKLPDKLIVCLWAAAKHGKSSTLKHLAELLIPNPAAKNVTWYLYHPKNRKITRMPKNISTWKKDICVTVPVRRKKLIGINSIGDTPRDVKKHLTILANDNCDKIFCAVRTMGETVTEVVNIAKAHNYKIIWIHTYTPDFYSHQLRNTVNAMQAKHLKDFI